jgi:methionyl-tRNA formyltransferase
MNVSALAGAPTLSALIEAGYHIAAVVANYEAGTSRTARTLEVAEVAKVHNIPVLLPDKPASIRDQLAGFGAEAAVLVAYGKLIPQSIIDIFPKGILNIHPSLLPQYRGSTPIEQAILDGASVTGVSIMRLVKAMDAGPIFAQAAMHIDDTVTKQALTQKLLELGGELLLETLPKVLDASLAPKPQDESKASYTSLIQKSDAMLDLTKSAERLAREVRAYAGWPKSKINLFDHTIIVTKARIVTNEHDGIIVLTCNPGYLAIEELIAPSGRTMSAADFVRGYKR